MGRGTVAAGTCVDEGLSRLWKGARSNSCWNPCLRSSFSCFPRTMSSHSKYMKKRGNNDQLEFFKKISCLFKKLKPPTMNSGMAREMGRAQEQQGQVKEGESS